jgi:flavin-dependent dehydrogenase
MSDYDLIVCGGGPAGASAAITAARSGARVLLLERGRYPRHKVCGEFVSAEALSVLGQLLPEHTLLDSALRIHQSRLFVAGTEIEIDVAPAAISLTRFDLDAALWRASELAGVTALQQTVARQVTREGRHFLISTTAGEFVAQAVILAAGRWSGLDGMNAPTTDGDEKRLGIKAHFVDRLRTVSTGTVELHFFEGGYCGVQSVADGIVSACAMVRPDVATTLPQVFERCQALADRARKWQPCFSPITTYPLLFHSPCPERNGILYVGDAAGFVDPFVGDGISLALNSGASAARALTPMWRKGDDMDDCRRIYRREYQRRFMRVFRNAALIRRLLNRPVLRKGAARLMQIPAISKQFVRLTRAA